MIVDLLIIPKLQYLASASMDKLIILWDLTTLTSRRIYKKHTKVYLLRDYQVWLIVKIINYFLVQELII